MMRPPRPQMVPPARVPELLATGHGVPDPVVSSVGRCEAYRLSEDQILIVLPDGQGRLFGSRRELLMLAAEWDASDRRPTHPMSEWLPHGREFIADIPRLAAEFTDQLDEWLKDGRRGLDAVDALILQRGAALYLSHDEFQRLLAYVGELIRRRINGEWHMVHTADDRVWEPWISAPWGYQHKVFAVLLGELLRWGMDSSIERSVEHDLKVAELYRS